jgi:hypothetical protein
LIGDTVIIDGVEYEIVWAGGEGLTADRETKPGDTWTPPPRLYNKTGKYSKKKKEIINVGTCDD